MGLPRAKGPRAPARRWRTDQQQSPITVRWLDAPSAIRNAVKADAASAATARTTSTGSSNGEATNATATRRPGDRQT
jgi:hypothetical protein